MLVRVAGKLLWFGTKMTVKYVVVPIAITAFWAAMLEKYQEHRAEAAPNGLTAELVKR